MHTHSLNGKAAWQICHNEPNPGQNPYAISNPEMLEKTMQRNRNLAKEIGQVPFTATCRQSMPLDDKVKVNSLHMMDSLSKAYLLSTSKSPSKVMTLTNKRASLVSNLVASRDGSLDDSLQRG